MGAPAQNAKVTLSVHKKAPVNYISKQENVVYFKKGILAAFIRRRMKGV